MYRIAIISDIHGNIYALDAFLKDIKEKGIEFFYCPGDMIGIDPFSNEVLETLFEIDTIQMITGNHDESVLAVINNKPYLESRINVMPHHEWIANRLKKEFVEGLSKLPRQITKTYDGHALQFIHYPMNPSSYTTLLAKIHLMKLGCLQ